MNSNSGSSSSFSTESKKGAGPLFIAQVNYLKTSTFMKSSQDLSGGVAGMHEFDGLGYSNSRPSRPKLDPFKKFDGSTSNRRVYRNSFDDSL